MNKVFSERLLKLRKEKHLSQEELARKIGVTDGAISFWEKGENEPKLSYIFSLSKVLNVSSDYLLGLTDN